MTFLEFLRVYNLSVDISPTYSDCKYPNAYCAILKDVSIKEWAMANVFYGAPIGYGPTIQQAVLNIVPEIEGKWLVIHKNKQTWRTELPCPTFKE